MDRRLTFFGILILGILTLAVFQACGGPDLFMDIQRIVEEANKQQVEAPALSPAGGLYNTDQNVSITTATTGAQLYYTTDGSTPGSSSTEYTGTPVSVAGDGTNMTIQAIAVKDGMTDSEITSETYTIDYSARDLTVNNDGNGTTTPSGTVVVTDGSPYAISATPAGGYTFTNWTQTGGGGTAAFDSATSASTNVTVTGGDATIQANFAVITRNLTINNDGNGSTTPSGAQVVNDGASTAISATPNADYGFVNWTQTGGGGTAAFDSATSASTNVTVTGGDATIQANFAQYTLTVNDDGNGSTTPAGSTPVGHGVPEAISATPSGGYTFVNWTQTGGTGTAVFDDAGSASTNVTVTGGNATIQANFTTSGWNLTINNDGNGSTTPSGTQVVADGSPTAISATPNADYGFYGWTQSGGSGTAVFDDASAASTNVTVTGGDVIIQADFDQHTLTVYNDGNGTTNPAGNTLVGHGVPEPISATPSGGYLFLNWTQTGGLGTAVFDNATFASTNVTVTGGDATIQANFALNTYSLTMMTLPAGTGTTTPSGTTPVDHGVPTAISVTPDIGYVFSHWSQEAGAGTAVFDNANNASTNVTVTDMDVTVAANLVPEQYTLTLTNDGNGTTVPPAGSVTVEHDVPFAIAAVPDAGYEFNIWQHTTGPGVAVFDSPTSAATNVTVTGGDATIEATFTLKVPDIAIARGGSSPAAQQCYVWHNNGSGARQADFNVLPAGYYTGIAAGDLDNDNDVDLIVTGRAGTASLVFLNDGTGYFNSGDTFEGTPRHTCVALGDLNGDGYLDVVLGNKDGTNRSSVFWNQQDGTFSEPSAMYQIQTQYATGVALADFDGDTDIDVFVGLENQPNEVYLNNGTGALTLDDSPGGWELTQGIVSGDIDNDGDIDVVGINESADHEVFINDGSGNFSVDITIANTEQPYDAALGDFDHDNDLDLVIVNGLASPQTGVYEFNGSWYTLAISLPGAADPTSVDVGDINDDEHLDIVVGNDGTVPYFYSGYGSSCSDFSGQDALPTSTGNTDYASDIVVFPLQP